MTGEVAGHWVPGRASAPGSGSRPASADRRRPARGPSGSGQPSSSAPTPQPGRRGPTFPSGTGRWSAAGDTRRPSSPSLTRSFATAGTCFPPNSPTARLGPRPSALLPTRPRAAGPSASSKRWATASPFTNYPSPLDRRSFSEQSPQSLVSYQGFLSDRRRLLFSPSTEEPWAGQVSCGPTAPRLECPKPSTSRSRGRIGALSPRSPRTARPGSPRPVGYLRSLALRAGRPTRSSCQRRGRSRLP